MDDSLPRSTRVKTRVTQCCAKQIGAGLNAFRISVDSNDENSLCS